MQELVIKVKRLHEDAIMPTRDEGDAGWDLYALEDAIINPGDVVPIKTGIALGIPKGYRIAFRDRSGLGRQGLTITGGLIDNPYIGELIVCLANIKTRYMIHFIVDLLKNMMVNVVEMLMSKMDGNDTFKAVEFEINSLDAAAYYVYKGDRITQFVLEEDPQFVSLLEVDELEPTKRGDKGFGSSGR